MKIGLDLDEVCCDLATHMCNYIDSAHDEKHDHEVFSSYNFYDNAYTGDGERNHKIADDLVTQVNNLKWLLRANPIPGVSGAVHALKSAGHEVHILTARAEGEEKHTEGWLHYHDFHFDSVTHVGYGSCKGVIGKEMGLDVFVDDHTYNIDSMLEHHPEADLYLITRPWNTGYMKEGVTRIDHVSDLFKELNLIGEINV